MANTARIKEVTLAQISDKTNAVNLIAGTVTANVKQNRVSAYEPMVVRVTDHDADNALTGTDSEEFALFCSRRHGEPWEMIGHQGQHIIHPAPGVAAAPIVPSAGGTDFSVIYVDFDYDDFT